MNDITQMERTAIQEARRSFAEALIKCGFGAELERLTGEQVDMVIERTWDALRASMLRQSAQGEIPFPLTTASGDAKASSNSSTAMASVRTGGNKTIEIVHFDDINPQLGNGDPPVVPPGYFINAAGHLLKKDSLDDDIPF